MRYWYDIIHVPGKKLVAEDVLSRKPLPMTDDNLKREEKNKEEMMAYVQAVISTIPCTERILQVIIQAEEDEVCQLIESYSLQVGQKKIMLTFRVAVIGNIVRSWLSKKTS